MICLIQINDVWVAWLADSPDKLGIGDDPNCAIQDLNRMT